VDALGRLVSVEVMAPSGQPALDAAAVAAVRAAAPFAPPPAGPIAARFTINLGR
jgi:TonB family protein